MAPGWRGIVRRLAFQASGRVPKYNEMMYGFFFYTLDGERLNLRINSENGRVVRE